MNPRIAMTAVLLATATACWRSTDMAWQWDPDQQCWDGPLEIPRVPTVDYHSADISVYAVQVDENGDCWLIFDAVERPDGPGWGNPPAGVSAYTHCPSLSGVDPDFCPAGPDPI